MATIMVDYENVNSTNGLKGVEYLTAEDTLYIFYSQCCNKIRAGYMMAIEKSGCDFRTCKLARTGKNALDFYIASECGIVSENGESQIVIVSRDQGFSAVVDYFKIRRNEAKTTVVTAPDIETGLMKLDAPDDFNRRNLIQENSKMLDLAVEEARYAERNAVKSKLKNALIGTKYEGKIAGVLDCLHANTNETPKRLYVDSLHRFGRSDGTEIYRILKKVI